ncbi:MAG: HIT domain-containing protein [Chloroflexi bacterium]|nr:HIT domain-containing protein [Chloroflexota bacterium]
MGDDFYCAQVLSGKTVVNKIVETETVLAFNHTRPAYPVHIVVIPKKHVASFVALDDTILLAEMIGVMQQVAATVLKEHGGCRIITNLGCYQDSKHLQWHIIFGERIKRIRE